MKPQQLEKLAQNPHYKMTKEQLEQLEHYRKPIMHSPHIAKHSPGFNRNNRPMEHEK